jgi:pyruvate dehydrogenase E2 component (dihydrolipoamide acetyltransferase)
MPIQVLMPALSPTMTEGNLAKWHKKEGDVVKAGDVLAEIETDKATMEMEAVDEGTLGRIIVPEGTQGVKVNAPIALILGEDEDPKALEQAKAVPALAPTATTPSPQPSPQGEREGAGAVAPPKPAPAPRAGNGHAAGERIFISPLARRLAQQAGLDPARLSGSGPHGRIVKADVEAAVASGGVPRGAAPAAGAPAVAPTGAPPALPSYRKEQVIALAGNPPYTEVPINAMRRVIARRLTESKQTVPHFYLTVDCEIDKLLEARAAIAASADVKVSVNDFVIKAAAIALRKVPEANASWSEDAILRWNAVDIAVAVALDDGLITPIVKNADQKGLAQIAAEMKDLGARARTGKLKLTEFQGGTFSISNMGMFGVKDFAAVINPPQGCILAVGVGEQRPVVKNGALAVANVMSCTLACDHRVVDGAVGARYMQVFKKLIEAPATMLL